MNVRHARDVRVHRVADRHAFVGERRVVVVDPVLRLFGIDERERERADRLLRGEVDRVAPAARDPQRRVRLLPRLRHDVAGRHRDELARVAGERRLGHAAHRDAQTLFPHRALALGIDHEPAELGLRRRLAGAEVGAAAAHEVEHRDALGDARRMVERRRRLHDAVPEPDVLRALRRGREEHLGRARVRVLLEEVVLDLPRVVDAERVGVLDLVERVLDQPVLGVVGPGPRELVLVEDRRTSSRASAPRRRARRNSSRMSSRRGCDASACSTSRHRLAHEVRRGSRRATARARRPTACRSPRRPAIGRARLADERAVAHLGERGAQVVDVRASRRRGCTRRGRRRAPSPATRSVSASTSSAHANVWNAETSMNSSPTMRRTIISSERSMSGKRRSASALRRISSGVGGLPSAGTMPMRTSIVCVMSSVTGISNAMSRAANHICLWPGFFFPARFVARVRLEQAASAGARSRCRRCSRRSGAACSRR